MTSREHRSDNEDSSGALSAAWELRAKSPLRRFFVASHRGWSDPASWRAHALQDLRTLFSGVTGERLAAARVLEIGCGVGRLAEHIAPKVHSYVGFDIARSMIAEAELERSAPNCRFFHSEDGSIPDVVGRGRYEFIFSWAVMIHMPLELIESAIRSASQLLSPSGEMRLQLRADPNEYDTHESYAVVPAPLRAPGPFSAPDWGCEAPVDDLTPQREAISQLVLANDSPAPYLGHVFTVAEATSLIARQALSGVVVKLDPNFIYVVAHREPESSQAKETP